MLAKIKNRLNKLRGVYKQFRTLKSFQKMYEDGIGWGDAKTYLFDHLSLFLSSYKKEYLKIIKDRVYVESVLKEGANKALEVSTPLIEDIRNSVGIKGF